MRSIVIVLVVLTILAVLAPTPANADIDSRVKKLEDEIHTIKETSKQILTKLESSVFEGIPQKIQATGRSIYDTIVHHSTNSASHVQKEYPKWLSFAKEYTKDLPTHATKTAAVLQREGTKHYLYGSKLLASFLAQQGVPQQYIQYITLGVFALIGIVVIVITFSLLSAIIGYVCCCGNSRQKQNKEIKKKNDKKAAEQHKQHEKKLAQ